MGKSMLNRRKMLGIGAAAVGAALPLPQVLRSTSAAASGKRAGNPHDLIEHPNGTVSPHAAPPPFSVEMPVPRVLKPFKGDPDIDFYRLPITPANVEILPGVQTPVLTFGGDFIGPTIRAQTGRPAWVTYTNQLNE